MRIYPDETYADQYTPYYRAEIEQQKQRQCKIKHLHCYLYLECNRRNKPGRLDRQYRTVDLIEDRLGGIAYDESGYACAGYRAHDDQIRFKLPG